MTIVNSLDYFLKVAALLKTPEPVVETADKTEAADVGKEEESFLEKELKNIDVTALGTVLYSYLNRSAIRTTSLAGTIIYPFGSNRSQMEAVRMEMFQT